MKGSQTGKEVKLPLFANYMIINIGNVKKKSPKTRLVSRGSKVKDTRSVPRNQLYFYILTMNTRKLKF